jgi:alpha-ketoglutarate-dependent taurine dioxygenase
MSFEAIDLTPRIATQIKIDKATLLSGEHNDEFRAILEQRGVLLFRDMPLSDEEEMRLGATLGTVRQDFGRPILRVTFDKTKNPDHADYFHATFHWHMDGTHDDVPPLASILTPRVLAPHGTGHTEFANTYAAWDDLPDEEKAKLEGLSTAHTQLFALPMNEPPTEQQLERVSRLGTRVHPLVWNHKSGRKSLILGGSVRCVVGMDPAESDVLLARLLAWTTQPRYVYHHEWRMDDVLMWNNTGTLHRVLPYDKDSGRRLHRVTLVGEEPFSKAA